MAERIPVVLLPGGVLPAGPAYDALVDALGPEIDARPKELELYGGLTAPPADYDLATEVEGIARHADQAGFGSFHLVGYSAGGAASLFFAQHHPGRLRSLTLMEPAWAGRESISPEEREVRASFGRSRDLPPDEFMARFVQLQLAPDVEPPPRPSGEPPPWMRTRPAGLRALVDIFDRTDLDRAALGACEAPVLFVLGGRSNQDLFGRTAARLREVFADFTLEVFDDRHHFDPPHRTEPERLAGLLHALWRRAESGRSADHG